MITRLSSAKENASLVLIDWGLRCAQNDGALGGIRLAVHLLGGSACSHPFDQSGVGHRESLNAFKVGLLSLKPLCGYKSIEKPVPLELC